MTPPEAGSFPLTGTGKLPHVAVAFPGEHWSDRVASGSIVPGEAVVPAGSATARGNMVVRTAGSGDSALVNRLAIALRPIDVPDINSGPAAKGPNEIKNTAMVAGDWVHCYYSGAFTLTLVDPRRAYKPGDMIGWDADGQRPVGVAGEGSWAPNANADLDDILEVTHVDKASNGEFILKVRTLRGQF